MISAKQIIKIVAIHRNLSADDLIGQDRQRHLAWPRQEVYWACRLRTKLSLTSIARLIGGRDHTTVRAGIHAIETRRKQDPDYREQLDDLLTKIDLADAMAQSVPQLSECPLDVAFRIIRNPKKTSQGDVCRMALALVVANANIGNAALSDREARAAVRTHLTGSDIHPIMTGELK